MTATPTHIPAPLRTVAPSAADFTVRKWLGQEPLSVAFAVGDQSGMARTVTLTVRNLAGEACKGLFAIRIIVGTAADGGPAGTQTVAVTTGSTVEVVVADQVLDVLTDANGVAAFSLTLGGAGTRHVRAIVGGVVQGSGAVAWT